MTKEVRRPALKLDLLRKLGILIVVNILPLVVCLVVFAKWMKGEIVITNVNVVWAAAILFAASVIYVLCFWMLMPTAKWFKEYAFWQYQQGTSALWFLPLVLSHILWLVTWIFCIMAGLIASTAIVSVIIYMIKAAQGG